MVLMDVYPHMKPPVFSEKELKGSCGARMCAWWCGMGPCDEFSSYCRRHICEPQKAACESLVGCVFAISVSVSHIMAFTK